MSTNNKTKPAVEVQQPVSFKVGGKTYELTRLIPVNLDGRTVTPKMIAESKELQKQLVDMKYGHVREVIAEPETTAAKA